MGLKTDLISFAKRNYGEWINGGEFERFAMELGYKPSNASRRLRELADNNIFDHRYNEKRQVEYKYLAGITTEKPSLFQVGARQW